MFMNKHGYISLNNERIPICHLVSPAKKLVISNASPHIPDSLIETALLKAADIRLCSQIIHLKGSFESPLLKHIHSFRRAVWYLPKNKNETIQFPDSLILTLSDNEEYLIFLNVNSETTCFLCKSKGHIAKSYTSPSSIVETETSPSVTLSLILRW